MNTATPTAAPPDACPQAPDPADPVTGFVEALMRFARLARSWDGGMGLGVSRVQIALLARLQRKGPSRLTALAGELGTELSVVSRQCAALLEAGMIERVRDSEDKRAWLVSITPWGCQTLAVLWERRRGWFAHNLEGFTDDQFRAAAQMVNALADAGNRALRHGTPSEPVSREQWLAQETAHAPAASPPQPVSV